MYKTEHSIAFTKANQIYKLLLLFYPAAYRNKFGEEMLITFDDLYQEKMNKNENTGFIFWCSLGLDIIKSAFEQHNDLLKKQGMKKYMHKTLHINKYNIIGGILLLPFFSVFLIDTIARIAQGDLTHYNRPVYAMLSHSLLYWFPILFTWVILFPALAVVINLIPLIRNAIKKHSHLKQFDFIKENWITLAILFIGLGFLAIIKFHDFAPCMFHGFQRMGFSNIPYMISVCQRV